MTNRLSKFERELLESIEQMKAGDAARVHTPEVIRARRGRPALATRKTAVKLRLDADLVEAMRASGPGWQTRANNALRREMLEPAVHEPEVQVVVVRASARQFLSPHALTLAIGDSSHTRPTSYGRSLPVLTSEIAV
jgi:uncharacterized protein (DUF4415 family)